MAIGEIVVSLVIIGLGIFLLFLSIKRNAIMWSVLSTAILMVYGISNLTSSKTEIELMIAVVSLLFGVMSLMKVFQVSLLVFKSIR